MKKHKPSRLLVLTYGSWDHASSRTRAIQYIPLLEEKGRYYVLWIPRVPQRPHSKIKCLWFAFAKRWLMVKRIFFILFRRWDLILVQRLFLPGWLVEMLKHRKTPIFYDFDDAIYLDQTEESSSETRTALMVRSADIVIVGSTGLVPYCESHGSSPCLINTPVDTDRIKPRHGNDNGLPFTIGWVGSHWTTKYIQDIAPALTEVANLRDIRLLMVGADQRLIDLPNVSITYEPWSFDREPQLLSQMSVGIMPLPDDPWTRGKGAYKLMLYMAAGLPVVASRVGMNLEVVSDKENGFLVDDQIGWVEALLRLVDDQDLRRKMGENGRERAVAKYSRMVCFKKLLASLDNVLNSRR